LIGRANLQALKIGVAVFLFKSVREVVFELNGDFKIVGCGKFWKYSNVFPPPIIGNGKSPLSPPSHAKSIK
jgi:hypothetical protein